VSETALSKLYVIPTPIGNLGDITLRSLEVLKNCDVVLAEDTRTTGKLFSHYDIHIPLRSFHIHNEHKTVDKIISELTSNSRKYGLVSDAGTPGISDPGFLLVRTCLSNNIDVECLPGATALIPALVNSGFPTDRFVFEGFLPHKKGKQSRINEIAMEKRTVVLYESPHRFLKTLVQLEIVLGSERYVSVSRELTKIYEETVTDTLGKVIQYFEAKPSIKGEFVIVIAPQNF